MKKTGLILLICFVVIGILPVAAYADSWGHDQAWRDHHDGAWRDHAGQWRGYDRQWSEHANDRHWRDEHMRMWHDWYQWHRDNGDAGY